mmetsp:Transcript_61399/g.136796  ORF Transcript_61399/g.136796 Transcript_61399/m.136796 type:complete len:185 (-) Transcript_61399:1328-1882(-)|eukprot:CAMPEP_0181195518 /NCGR_PEP_ID=MMETSP1096-20121128/14934_1 /TAXON_ID=156174 ORGANISM="Chrysochromulina ericina, Strain CCMP281" /NCGR_SAMPLE_ID=MMETSP1096 /ASSEMBLY_ACC=CAM_ASM_000453 /LENGTH=184 /DNA_ID=CAMNT_0023285135 /DNA_START=123 /DNA_END=677 /DNA_ORIENTATION=-
MSLVALTFSALAFSPSCMRSPEAKSQVSRRALFSQVAGLAAAAVAVPAFADGANSAQGSFKARSIYGSRIFRLKGASSAAILEEKNAFTLFTTGTFRTIDQKPIKTELTKLTKSIVAAAEKGDDKTAQALVGDFIKVGSITKDYTAVQGGNFNPTQRRNAGAPGTQEIEDQMGPLSYALYKPVK